MSLPAGVEFHATVADRYAPILTPEALAFILTLQREFNLRRKELLAARIVRQKAIDAGDRPNFLPETANIRAGDWKIAQSPPISSTAASRSPAPSTAR
jgi:malate synthase